MARAESEWQTRKRCIDPKLDAAGWPRARARGPVRPHRTEEHETANGPADYALWLDGHVAAVVEAKKLTVGPQNVLTQADRYARGLTGSPYEFDGRGCPFLYATNGEVIWFHDVRHPLNRSRQLAAFHTPGALSEMFGRDFDAATSRLLALANDGPRLRPYQRDANAAVEKAIAERKRHLLVAMATGTGKTFTLVNQVHRLMKSGVAKRVLFLVDRRALAAQAVRAFSAFETSPGLKFDKEYEVYSSRFQMGDFDEDEKFDPKLLPANYLTDPSPDHAFVYVCTIQRMAMNVLGRDAVPNLPGASEEALDQDAGKGTTHTTIYFPAVLAFHLNLAPLAEQRRIVEKVESLLAQVNAAKTRLAKLPLLLKRFRQSILSAACSGQLTEDWRSETAMADTARTALAVQFDRHRRAWESWRNASKTRARAKYEAPVATTRDDLPGLPETWCWVRLGLMGDDALAAVQTGPFGAMLHRDEFVSVGIPVIAVGNLTGLGFTSDGLYYVTRAKADELERFNVQAGDLLFARSGATLGKVCVAPDYVRAWRMTGHILRVRLSQSLLLPRFAAYALRGAPGVLEQVGESIRGATRPGYNTTLLEEIHVPLPPPAEQAEIVRRVEALFALADAIERRVAAATVRADALPQSILSKAFRGDLVPTEASLARAENRDYESAAALLERIRAEQATSQVTTPARGRGRGTKGTARAAPGLRDASRRG